MVEAWHSKKPKISFSCSPVALFGVGLIVAQLAILNIGVNFFHREAPTGQADNLPIHADLLADRKRVERTKPTRQRIVPDPNSDGTFNGYPIYFEEKQGVRTSPHCVGENYQDGISWKHRSCKFDFFCFDTSTKEYVVFETPEDTKIYSHVEKQPFLDVSQSYLKVTHNKSNTVSLGGINLKWTNRDDGIPRLEWFPEVRTVDPSESVSYYMLPPSVVMVPFHSMNGANPGHLVWDDFLPIFTLMTMFQLEDESNLLMMRYILKGGGRGLWASCDVREDKQAACAKMHKKFLPLMMGPDPIHDLTTTENFNFQPKETKSNLVCARNGLAGMGALTDHGTDKLHGWEEDDYKVTQNHGRGGMLYEFRNYMMSNLGYPVEFEHKPPFRIVFSENSSSIPSRVIDFSMQMEVLRKSFNPKYVSIESYVFKDLSLVEQLDIASQTTIYITGVGGGAVTATFLPRGASVLLYFLEQGGMKDNKETGSPARLDWDLFNNMGYLKVHWLPMGTMQKEADLRSLALLVQHELDAHMRERSYDKFFF